jgi:hypothetical protein
VHELAADEAELAVDGGGGAAGVGPGGGGVVWEGGVGVLEERDCDWIAVLAVIWEGKSWGGLPSQWLTQRYGMKYHTSKFVQPKFLPMVKRMVPTIAKPRSLSRIRCESLAS